jgi:hypothetical protein
MSVATRGVLAILKAALNDVPEIAAINNQAFRFQTDTVGGEIDTLSWLGNVPGFVEKGNKVLQAGKTLPKKLDIRLREFTASWQLAAKYVRNSKVGPILTVKAAEWGRRRVDLADQLVCDLLNNGASLLAYDGIAFWSDSHSDGRSGTIDNNITFDCSDHTNPTALEIAKAISKGIETFWGFKDDQGLPTHARMVEVDVVVPVGIAGLTLQAVSNEKLDSGAGDVTNPLSGFRNTIGLKLNVRTSPLITLATTKIALVNRSPGAMPFLLGENPAEKRVTELDESSDLFKREDLYEYNAFWTGAASVGEFRDSVLITLN